jgi:signal transduction histidine kinase
MGCELDCRLQIDKTPAPGCFCFFCWQSAICNLQSAIEAMTLRQRLLLPLAPSLLLMVVLGTTGIVLLLRLGNQIDLILKENYVSVVAMVGLNEALERIDSSYTFALLGDDKAADAYVAHWKKYQENLDLELANITILPREQELCDELVVLTRRYRRSGDRFFSGKLTGPQRQDAYVKGLDGHPGLLQQFKAIKQVTEEIREINQRNMEEARDNAQQTARNATIGFASGLLVIAGLAALFAWQTVRSIIDPIQDVTRSARAIGAGDLEQVVPVLAHDELGELAEAFNRMARQLRDYRRSHLSRLLRAQRTSQAAIDSFPDPILVVDPDGRVEMANPAARGLFGIAAPPAPGAQSPADVEAPLWHPPPSLVEPLRQALQNLRGFVTQAFDQTVSFRVGGEERAYLPQILPIQDPYGGLLGAAVVLSDVTRFRLLDQIKSDLVATVSHELKTPLTSVRLVLHLLLEETVGPLTAKQAELLIDARDNAERLLNMIEHLLALARLEQARDALVVRPEPPGDLLRTAAEHARPRAEDRHIELSVQASDDLPPVAVDSARLAQALNNLLDNALTWTPPGGRIILSAERPDERHVRLSVRDTGPGIPVEHLPHVFERFFRVPGQTSPHGTGLGLAIVREIVTALHGSVSCESPPGGGATFHLLLPVWAEAA